MSAGPLVRRPPSQAGCSNCGRVHDANDVLLLANSAVIVENTMRYVVILLDAVNSGTSTEAFAKVT